MAYAAFLLGFFLHASLAFCTRNRQRADLTSTLPTAWQLEQWKRERTKMNPRLRLVK